MFTHLIRIGLDAVYKFSLLKNCQLRLRSISFGRNRLNRTIDGGGHMKDKGSGHKDEGLRKRLDYWLRHREENRGRRGTRIWGHRMLKSTAFISLLALCPILTKSR